MERGRGRKKKEKETREKITSYPRNIELSYSTKVAIIHPQGTTFELTYPRPKSSRYFIGNKQRKVSETGIQSRYNLSNIFHPFPPTSVRHPFSAVERQPGWKVLKRNKATNSREKNASCVRGGRVEGLYRGRRTTYKVPTRTYDDW